MDSDTISYLKGTVASLNFKTCKEARSAVSVAIGQRLLLNVDWYLEYNDKKRGFMVTNIEDQDKCFPICPIQTPLPCPYYSTTGISCPRHSVNLDSVETASVASSSSRTSTRVVTNNRVLTNEQACKTIYELYEKMQKLYGVKGNINNALVQKQVFDSLKESTSKTYHSKSLRYNVVLVNGYGEDMTNNEKKREKVKKAKENFHTLGSLLIVDDDSSFSFYTCREAGCFKVGTEVFKTEYVCNIHTHELTPNPTRMRVHRWVIMAVDLLIIRIFHQGEGLKAKPSHDTWNKLLYYIYKLGKIGVQIPFAGSYIKIWIGSDRRTFNYYRYEDMNTTRRQCSYPYCLKQSLGGDLVCGECVLKDDWINPVPLFKRSAYGRTTSSLEPDSELWIHELNPIQDRG